MHTSTLHLFPSSHKTEQKVGEERPLCMRIVHHLFHHARRQCKMMHSCCTCYLTLLFICFALKDGVPHLNDNIMVRQQQQSRRMRAVCIREPCGDLQPGQSFFVNGPSLAHESNTVVCTAVNEDTIVLRKRVQGNNFPRTPPRYPPRGYRNSTVCSHPVPAFKNHTASFCVRSTVFSLRCLTFCRERAT